MGFDIMDDPNQQLGAWGRGIPYLWWEFCKIALGRVLDFLLCCMSYIIYKVIKVQPLGKARNELFKFCKDVFCIKSLPSEFEGAISDFMGRLVPSLNIVAEYPYVDKFYRDSFYSYYSSKHSNYHRDCIRLSFFEGEISSEDFLNSEKHIEIQQKFRGFLVVRPTFTSPIGRSILSNSVIKGEEMEICGMTTNVSVRGLKLSVTGFPHSSQDEESISCAETTIWAIMEYFGNKYPDYTPVLPSQIHKVLMKKSSERILPSNGMTADQISFGLRKSGFGTLVYASQGRKKDALIKIVSIYVESGIPVIISISNSDIGHVMVAIGHEKVALSNVSQIPGQKSDFKGINREFIDFSDFPRAYIIQDDNHPPYQRVFLDRPVDHYSSSSLFQGAEIDCVVVPLYKRIHLEVDEAKRLCLAILGDCNIGHDFGDGMIFRIFLASSRTFKEHLSVQEGMLLPIRSLLIDSALPKFIWCAEVIRPNPDKEPLVEGLILLDATEANHSWKDAVIFIGYPNEVYWKEHQELLTLQEGFANYFMFAKNLK